MKRQVLMTAALTVLFVVPVAPRAFAADKKIERVWKAKCASCHGMDGKADTKKGKEMAVANMADPAFQKKFTDDQLKKAINEGVNETRDGKKKEMDGFKEELKADQIDELVKYIRELK